MKKIMTVGYRSENDKQYSQIRLSGRWLERLGYRTGDKFSISTVGDSIVIMRIPEEQD